VFKSNKMHFCRTSVSDNFLHSVPCINKGCIVYLLFHTLPLLSTLNELSNYPFIENTNGYPCVYAIFMNNGHPFKCFYVNEFFGLDITMDITWILQPEMPLETPRVWGPEIIRHAQVVFFVQGSTQIAPLLVATRGR